MSSWRMRQTGAEEPRGGEVAVPAARGFVRVAYVEWGPPSAERIVLCVHGLTRNGRDFDELARTLAAHGCRVIAPDLPGRGRSGWLERWSDYDNALYVAAMSAVVARSGAERVDWVGTSLGGFIGMEVAARAGHPIRRLVLNEFGARVPATALRRIGASSGRYPEFADLAGVEAHLRDLLAGFGPLDDAQWRHLAEHGAASSPEGGLRLAHDPAVTVPFRWPFLTDFVLWHLWDRIHCPVLILRGAESDFLLPDTVRAMRARGPAAASGLVESVEFAGTGHAPALMSREQIDAVAAFLLAPDPGEAAAAGR